MSKLNILEFAEKLKPWPVPQKRPSVPVFPEFRELAPHSIETYGPWPSLFSFHVKALPEVLELKDGILPALFFLKQNPDLDPKRCYFSPLLRSILPLQWREAQFVYLSASEEPVKLAYLEYYDGISSLAVFAEQLKNLSSSVTSLVLDLRLHSAREDSDAARLMELIRSIPASIKLITVDQLVQMNLSGMSCYFHLEKLLVGNSFLQEQVLLQGGGLTETTLVEGTLVKSYAMTPLARKEIYRQELQVTDPLLKKELFKVVKTADTLKDLLKPQSLRVIAELVSELEKHYD